MIAATGIVHAATLFALVVLSIAFLLTVYRVVKGPRLPDRILALDMLVGIAIGFIAVIAIRTGFTLYIDIAIALGLVGFLATVAFARFVLSRGPESRKRDAQVLDGAPQPEVEVKSKDTPVKDRAAPKKSRKTAKGKK